MSTIDWAKLTAPVPTEDLEYLPKAGKQLAYMTAQFVRRRLDSAAPGVWSYDVEPIRFSEGQPPVGDGEPFAVVGTITLASEDVHVSRSSIGAGKNFKEAETDAFKRAAQRLGIGNELYEMGAVSQPAAPRAGPVAKGLTEADKAVMREALLRDAADPRPGGAPATATTVSNESVPCPKCGGKTWDNRVGKRNPRAPDWKCRDRACDGVYWKDADVPRSLAAEAKSAFERPWEDVEPTDNLPF